jgi:hypothetical protein
MVRLLAVASGILLLGFIAWKNCPADPIEEKVFEVKSAPLQAAPMCPWREPERDMQTFFPHATRWLLDTRFLSGKRIELANELKRPLLPEENSLYIYKVFQELTFRGNVLVRRVKGDHGAIEVVIGVSPDSKVCGVRLQRLREPEIVTKELQASEWLGLFKGEDSRGPWRMTGALSQAAQASGNAIVQGIRSELVMLAMAEQGMSHSSHH